MRLYRSDAKLSLGMVASLQSPLPFHPAKSLYLASWLEEWFLISLLTTELALLSVGCRVCGRVQRDLGLSSNPLKCVLSFAGLQSPVTFTM